jgi:transcriptional regulator with XRE-family HTH domain
MSTVGERIREARERKAYGQAELARAIGVTPTSLWAIESGRHAPRPATLRKIAQALGVPIEELTIGTNTPNE